MLWPSHRALECHRLAELREPYGLERSISRLEAPADWDVQLAQSLDPEKRGGSARFIELPLVLNIISVGLPGIW